MLYWKTNIYFEENSKMTANTIAMYFKVDPTCMTCQDFWSKVEQMGELSLGGITSDPVTVDLSSHLDKLLVFQGQSNSHATVRVYSDGLITLDIQHLVNNCGTSIYTFTDRPIYTLGGQTSPFPEQYIRTLEDKLKNIFGEHCYESNSLYTPIKRGLSVWPYIVTADERLLEIDYDKVVFEKDSPWQNIRILHSVEHGNVLFLDNDIMLGESDLIYTQTLCCIGKENYLGKDVLILGGGDGGILNELLKEGPAEIIMAEIDEEVMKACRTHMRSVCGSSLDVLEGAHHKIRIEDCINVLHEYITEGRQFDFVINDLTEFPVDKTLKGYEHDFETTSLIMELSLKAVKPDGKLLARGNCLSALEYRVNFEKDIQTLSCEFKRKDVFIPSFHETYCLYEIWKNC